MRLRFDCLKVRECEYSEYCIYVTVGDVKKIVNSRVCMKSDMGFFSRLVNVIDFNVTSILTYRNFMEEDEEAVMKWEED